MATVITTAAGLQNVDLDLTGDYELANDIDMSGVAFDPLGGWGGAASFSGSFDGKGYQIKNLIANKAGDNFVGLFGSVTGTIQNVTLTSVAITGKDYIGGLVGHIAGTISNCKTSGTVDGEDYVGGLAGLLGVVSISDCSSSCTVTASANRGGGLIGAAGVNGFGVIINSYATGDVTVTGLYAGGFVGDLNRLGSVSRCFATGDVSGNNVVGGFVGWNRSSDIYDSYAKGDVTETGGVFSYAGGFCAINTNWAPNATGSIINCYSTGAIAGAGTHGGFIADNDGGAITDCFWDITASGEAASDGGTGKTTTLMKTVTTFQEALWAISQVWNLISSCNDGYPCLIGVNTCCIVAAQNSVDQTIIGNKVSLEAIRNLEIVYGGRFYINKSGNAVYESRYHRNT